VCTVSYPGVILHVQNEFSFSTQRDTMLPFCSSLNAMWDTRVSKNIIKWNEMPWRNLFKRWQLEQHRDIYKH
jgi:hypothetical protein